MTPVDLLIDGQGIQGEGRRRGVGRYARELLAGIARVRPDWRLRLAVAGHLGEVDVPPGVEVVRYDPPAPVSDCHGATTALVRLHYADWLRAHRPAAVLVLSPFEARGLAARYAGGGPPTLAVFYDLIPLLFADQYLHRQPDVWAFYAAMLRRVAACDGLLAISEATRRDLTDRLRVGGVTNIRGAVASDLPNVTPGEARRVAAEVFVRKGYPAKAAAGFLLYVGGGDFRKSLDTLLAAYAKLPRHARAGRPVVIVGELGVVAIKLRATAEALGISLDLILLGHVSDAELAALYQAARLFVFPSLYEGLGLPVLEALACGTDVAAAGTSAVPEYSGPGTDYFDPADPADMARVIYRCLSRPEASDPAAKRAFAAGFTWDATAEAACRAVEGVLADPPPARQPRRVVWRRSFPPASTPGDLVLFCQVLNSDRGCDLTLMRLPDDPPLPAAVARRVRGRGPDELAKAEEVSPTAVHVYELDTAADVAAAAPWLVRRPGLVVLSAALARSGVWADGRLAAGLTAADGVLVRGPAGGPLPPPLAAAARSEREFATLFAAAEAAGRTPDRQWRNAVVDALTQAPPMPPAFLDQWAALRAATPEAR